MNKIKEIEHKYRLNIEDLVPYENIQEEIDSIKNDLRDIDLCILKHKDKESIVEYAQKLQKNLCDKLEYLEDKLRDLKLKFEEFENVEYFW